MLRWPLAHLFSGLPVKEGICSRAVRPFSCNLIAGGKFYPAGEEVPAEVEVPGGARAYAIPSDIAPPERASKLERGRMPSHRGLALPRITG